ncbi:uncharacterized protein LOC135197317 [Macrobrachium nipponense]|uniref:uncharacterized protein LOC135197317 n=1 Tax=Macrobrachium nipponense TaxID=159736 RepID=UPI0030C839F3
MESGKIEGGVRLPEADTFVVFMVLWGSIFIITIAYLCRQTYLKIKEYLPIYLKKRKEHKSKKNSLPVADVERSSMLAGPSGVGGPSSSEGLARLHCVPESSHELECPGSSSVVEIPLEESSNGRVSPNS